MERPFGRRKSGGERGAVTVEFAMVVVPALLVILGGMQYGWYFHVSEQTSGAASTVARRLSVGDCWGSGEALAFAKRQASETTTVTKTPTSITPTTARGTEITVTVAADASIIGFFPLPNGGNVSRTVVTRLEDTEVGTC